MTRLAIIGLGNIGGAVLEHLRRHPVPNLELAAVCEREEPGEKIRRFLDRTSVPLVQTPAALLEHSPDWVLEAASQDVAAAWTPVFLEKGISLIILSVGGLYRDNLYRKLGKLCRPNGPRIVIPSGAIGGLDLIRAAEAGKLKRVHLRTTKPATAIDGGEDAPEGPVTLYRGNVAGCIALYPRNINVAMSLALAGLGPDETTVEIVADPACTVNTHQVFVEGDFGTAEITLRNLPSPHNPRTSVLAALSAISSLRGISSGLTVGG